MGLILVGLASQGMDCSEHRKPPSLATIRLEDIHVEIVDPATGTEGVYLSWSPPLDGKVSYYEIYQTFKKDSLGHSIHTQPASDTPSATLLLPDTSRPMTIYFAVQSVYVEATGQKIVSDTLPIDSLIVLPSFSILSPGTGTIQQGRILRVELETHSDPGIILKMFLFEKIGSKWVTKHNTCFPLNGCEVPIFGSSLQSDSLVLEEVAPGDTLLSLLCIEGTESFEGHKTGLNQSLGCSRFGRVRK